MPLTHKKEYGIYYWDTFDDTTTLIGERDNLIDAINLVRSTYKGKLKPDGADRVDIVNKQGQVVKKYSVG